MKDESIPSMSCIIACGQVLTRFYVTRPHRIRIPSSIHTSHCLMPSQQQTAARPAKKKKKMDRYTEEKNKKIAQQQQKKKNSNKNTRKMDAFCFQIIFSVQVSLIYKRKSRLQTRYNARPPAVLQHMDTSFTYE